MTLEDIAKIKLHDGEKLAILDTYEKIYFWVNHKFEEQKKAKRGELIIDFSDTIIQLENNELFCIKKLCGKIDGIDDLRSEREKENDGEYIIQRFKPQFEIRRKIAFDGAILYNAWFYDTIFCRVTAFTATKFMAGANFSGSIFNDAVSFNQIDISQKLHEEDKEKLPFLVGTAINFTHIHFKGPVYFNNLKWESAPYLDFSRNTYESEVRFIEYSINSEKGTYYNFSYSIFKGNVLISGMDIFVSFISHLLLVECQFHKEFKIRYSTIDHINMKGCNFYGEIDIRYNIYNENFVLDFSDTVINGIFSLDSDMRKYEGESIKLSKEINFSKAIIKPNAYLFFRNINYAKEHPQAGILNFEYASILGNITIQNSKLESIKLNKATVIGSISIEDVMTKFDCRESITKFKNEFIKRSDIVTSLTYKSLEMKTYRKELWENIRKDIKERNFKQILKFKRLPNLFLLTLNAISNSYGRRWFQGLIFTIIVGFIFYSFFAVASNPTLEFSVDYSNWLISDSYYWKKVLCFLWLPNFDGIKELTDPQNNTSIWGCIWFFLGKIFVAYGYYQTVSAFRKYGK